MIRSLRQVVFCGVMTFALSSGRAQMNANEDRVGEMFAGRDGALVFIDCSSGAVETFRPEVANRRLAPCSTFKIWNSLIGLDCGIVVEAEEPFYQWDGQKRSIAGWNRDLNLRKAFQASCVPAFQELARKIGKERMQEGVDRIGYGDRNISAGIDVFWLPAEGRRTILISPLEQAELMQKLVTGKLPFSEKSLEVLRRLMAIRTTDQGALYGKTGSGTGADGRFNLGWFVGYVEIGEKTFAFACSVHGEDVMSREARAIVEGFLELRGLARESFGE